MAAVSGAASLIYQVVWMRHLVLVFGSTTLAASTVVAAFLAGLALGAWAWGLAADRQPGQTLALFGLVEAATGLYALASPWLFRGVDALYLAAYPPLASRPALFAGTQFLLTAAVIVPPAALMGGALPLLARRLVVRPAEASGGAGRLYGWNTLGAAAGAALATYGLLPALGLAAAVRLAASANLLVGAFALLLDARTRLQGSPRAPAAPAAAAPDVPRPHGDPGTPPDRLAVYLVLQGFALSGFAVITFEVVWARLLALVVGSSVYAFGSLLVVILAGLGAGSAAYGRRRARPDAHLSAFGTLQVLIGAGAALSLLVVPHLPFQVVRFFPVFADSFAWHAAVQVAAAAVLAFVPAALSGAVFPAVVGGLGGPLARLGRTIGTAYGANTIGTVLGAFLAGFVLIPAVGLRAAMVLGVLATLLAGVPVLAVAIRSPARRAVMMAPAAVALLVVATLPPWPREVFAAGSGFFARLYGSPEVFERAVAAMRLRYYRDGIHATISVDETGGYLFYRTNGKTDASTAPNDTVTQVLLGQLPMLLHPNPQDVFVLGLGTGMTAAAVARYPVRRIDIVELEPAGLEAARLFSQYTRHVLDDPRVRVVVADGRNRLRAAPDRYDVIISDPSDIWIAGIGALYTVEFYQAARARLRPGGVMVQWVHTHSLPPEAFALIVATFRAVFPHTEIWTAAIGDLMLIGSVEALRWDYRRIAGRLEAIPGVREDLQAIGIWHPAAVLAAFALGGDDLDRLTRSVRRLHADDRPVLEFEAPRFLYADTQAPIHGLLSRLRTRPFPPVAGFDPIRDLDADATYLMGFAYASLGRPSLGIPYMERSTAMAPDRPAFFVGLANQYRAVGRPRDAEDAYRRALALDPDHVEALVSLGEILLEAGRPAQALAYAQRALRIAPADERAQALADRARQAR
ncbi:MAG: fused MFS/spermidine synthase [Armatimonadota bacterium]|nr:fused MFS/spermidine synthase [Armatimonadota bacterium]MDR7549409.1 fused MFS/spermidine synthase [Armatimonadota bacterium]